MRISYEWLREYVKTKIRAEHLASVLTMAGHEVTATEPKGKDFIFELEITPNRPDCLCHIGLAREVYAATGKGLKLPEIRVHKAVKRETVKVILENKLGCPRYSARVINGARVLGSPKWLIRRLESIGLRPINNIVDITNFVLFEMGQPLHAFDLDKLQGGQIVVRSARAGEKIVTIDGVERPLNPDILVIADKTRPVAIAGIMGGKETEVTESTRNILLESAYFAPVMIRRGALSLGLSTDSSYRFERGVDLAGVVSASDRATSLICDITRAQAGAITDAGIRKKEPEKTLLRLGQVNRLLGTKIKAEEAKRILGRLGFKCKGTAAIDVTMPSFRDDVTREADLIEEVARVYGYERIPLTAPAIITTDEEPIAEDIAEKKGLARRILASLGFNEVITYSLLSRDIIRRTSIPEEGTVEIENPLSKEQEIMRRSLLPGMIKTISYNISRQIQDIKIFELSNIYFVREANYNEEPCLAFAQYDKSSKTKYQEYQSRGLFRVKGAVSALSEGLGITELEFERTDHPAFLPGETLAVLSGNLMLGSMGAIRPEILADFDIKGEVVAAELNFKTVIDSSKLERFYSPLPRFPYSYRDVSFAADNQISYRDINSLIRKTGGLIVEEVNLLSEYRGEHIPDGQRGLALRIIYRSKEKTLTEEEVNKVNDAIRTDLAEKFRVTFR